MWLLKKCVFKKMHSFWSLSPQGRVFKKIVFDEWLFLERHSFWSLSPQGRVFKKIVFDEWLFLERHSFWSLSLQGRIFSNAKFSERIIFKTKSFLKRKLSSDKIFKTNSLSEIFLKQISLETKILKREHSQNKNSF